MSHNVHDVHQQQIAEGRNNNHNTLPILEIIGGIDKILADYLSLESIHKLTLNVSQLNKINTVLTSSPPKNNDLFEPKTIFRDIIKLNEQRDYGGEEIYYSFYENESIIFSYFDEEKASKILRAFNSKMAQIIVGISVISYFILIRFPSYTLGTLIHLIYSIIFTTLIWIPYCILFILCMNKEGLKLVSKSFEFWFKIITALFHFIAIWTDYFVFNYDDWQYPKLAVVERILFGISFILGVICISAFDAINLSRMWKIIISSLIAANALLWSIWSGIVLSTQDDTYFFVNNTIIQFTSYNIAISLNSLQITTMRVLAIFLWRQSILTYIRKNQTVLLKQTPIIIWVPDKNDYDEDDNKIKVTKQSVKQLHDQQLQNKYNNNCNAKLLVDILGGIDDILSNYLNTEANTGITQDSLLNQQQLNEMHQLLAMRSKSKLQLLYESESKSYSKKKENSFLLYYYFFESGTFLQYLSSKKTANKILTMFDTKMIKIMLYLCIIIYVIILLSRVHSLLFLVISISIIYLCFIPFCITFILSLNIKGFKLILSTFEFWIKISYTILYVVCISIDNNLLNADTYIYKELQLIKNISFGIVTILTIICVAMLDAAQTTRRTKIILSFSVTLTSTLWMLALTFFYKDKKEQQSAVLVISEHFAVDLLRLEISGSRVLAIFMCKQLFTTIRHKKKAALVKYIPYIQWYLHKNNDIDTNNRNDQEYHTDKESIKNTLNIHSQLTISAVESHAVTVEMEQVLNDSNDSNPDSEIR